MGPHAHRAVGLGGSPVNVSPEQLKELTKEQAIELLALSIETQRITTENLKALTNLLKEQRELAEKLQDQLATQEAELILLRNKPA